MRRCLLRKWLAPLALGAFVALNLVAYIQARAFTHFAPMGRRTPTPQRLSAGQKVGVLLAGVDVPRPQNRRTPADAGLPFERHVFPGVRQIPLEAWLVPQAGAHGTVALFHGHAASKDSQLAEAQSLQAMGWNVFLVDFHGSGGSGGDDGARRALRGIDGRRCRAQGRGR